MTVEVFAPAPLYLIAGTGPYPIEHPYESGAIGVSIVTARDIITLAPEDFTVTPETATIRGDLFLSPIMAALHAGDRLLIERHTRDEQGWQGHQGERERGLEQQLDVQTMAIQELRRLMALTLRSVVPIGRIVPQEGRTLMFDGTNIVPGPSGPEIMAAETYALAAAAAAGASEGAAAEAAASAAALEQRPGGFFANSVNPGSITRLANRVFVGDAWEFTGATQGNNTQETWLHASGGAQVQPGAVSITTGSTIVTGSNTQFTKLAISGTVTIGASVYTIAGIASDTSMTLTTPATQTMAGVAYSAGTATLQYLATFANLLAVRNYGIGVTGAVMSSTANSVFGGAFVAKTAVAGGRGWGLYVEGIKAHAGADNTHGMEIEVANLHPTVGEGFRPYGGRTPGSVWGLTVGSGADPVVNPVTYPADNDLAITGVGSSFMSGMIFEWDALYQHTDGWKRAILMPIQAAISWWDTGNRQVFRIGSNAQGAAKATSMVANNLGITYSNADGHPFLFLDRGPDGVEVDYPTLRASNGAGAKIAAGGPGANVNLELAPKGNGAVVIDLANLRSYGSDAGAAAGGVPVGGLYRSGNTVMVRTT